MVRVRVDMVFVREQVRLLNLSDEATNGNVVDDELEVIELFYRQSERVDFVDVELERAQFLPADLF
jgi:hypothetical protein